MCLAIFRPAGTDVPVEHLRNGWIGNPDGAGFAFVKDGEVEIRKGFMLLKDFSEAYKVAAEENPDSPFLIHFRIRSMGSREACNTHPYRLPDGGALIHNGTITGTGASYDKGDSDTMLFIKKFGESLTFDVVSSVKPALEKALDYNKLVMLWGDGRHFILNEASGWWEAGVWYSNGTFRSRPVNAPGYVDPLWEND